MYREEMPQEKENERECLSLSGSDLPIKTIEIRVLHMRIFAYARKKPTQVKPATKYLLSVSKNCPYYIKIYQAC